MNLAEQMKTTSDNVPSGYIEKIIEEIKSSAECGGYSIDFNISHSCLYPNLIDAIKDYLIDEGFNVRTEINNCNKSYEFNIDWS